jgi:hypothetical protein
MSDADDESADSTSNNLGDASGGAGSSSGETSEAEVGPGELAVDLSHVNECLRDLSTDDTIPPQERELNRGFYDHRRAKLQLQIAIFDKKERAQSDQSARSEISGHSAELERLLKEDSRWEERKAAARRWELSRRWEAITPDELKPAVEAIRETFDRISWQASQSTMKLCYAALHPAHAKGQARPDPEDLSPYKRFLVALVGPQVQQFFLSSDHPASAIFKSYLNVLETSLKVVVRTQFEELFEIAKARTDLLSMHPVEWTKRHLEILVFALKFSARAWIREVCEDSNMFRATGSRDDLFSGSFRVPKLIHMRPSGNTAYDAGSAWALEGLSTSLELLEALSNRMPVIVGFSLDKIVGAAHVEFVKQVGAKPTVSPKVESYRQRPPAPSVHPVTGAQASDAWRSLHDEFRALAEEELVLAPRNTGDRWLRAYVDYKGKNAACGQWHLSEGVSEDFRQRFEVSSTRAGIALGSALVGEPSDVWLHYVFSDLLTHNSKLLFAANDDGGTIVRACEASAIYCARLERQSLIDGINLARDAAVLVQAVTASPSNGEKATPMSPKDEPTEQNLREAVIRKVENPQTYTVLSIPEAVLYFEVRPRTIHRWTAEGKLKNGGRRGSITIESIRRLEKNHSRKRPSP